MTNHMRAFLLTIILIVSCVTWSQAQVAIIAHASVPVDSITKSEALDIYTGEIRQWQNGDPIVVLDLTEEGKVRDQFYKYLGRKPSRVKSIWLKNLLMGDGAPPEPADSAAEVLAKVAKTPGAIGFVQSDLANDSVKVLAIISETTGSQ